MTVKYYPKLGMFITLQGEMQGITWVLPSYMPVSVIQKHLIELEAFLA